MRRQMDEEAEEKRNVIWGGENMCVCVCVIPLMDSLCILRIIEWVWMTSGRITDRGKLLLHKQG